MTERLLCLLDLPAPDESGRERVAELVRRIRRVDLNAREEAPEDWQDVAGRQSPALRRAEDNALRDPRREPHAFGEHARLCRVPMPLERDAHHRLERDGAHPFGLRRRLSIEPPTDVRRRARQHHAGGADVRPAQRARFRRPQAGGQHQEPEGAQAVVRRTRDHPCHFRVR